jgi:phosphoribosylamine--glycine ligase
LDEIDAPTFLPRSSVCVVLASPGYPDQPRTGDTIEGLNGSGQLIADIDGVTVFHAGTGRAGPAGPFRTAGGRVLGVTAVAPTLSQARANAYAAVETIEFDGRQFRRDIAANVTGDRREKVG